jgi:hypothetical protein
MSELIESKIANCPEFTLALQETGNKYLAEATPDLFWGSGLNPDLTSCTRPCNFPGKNMLGLLLMEKRSFIYLCNNVLQIHSPQELNGDQKYDEAIGNSESNEEKEVEKTGKPSNDRRKYNKVARSSSLTKVNAIMDKQFDIKSFFNNKRTADSSPDKEGTNLQIKKGK